MDNNISKELGLYKFELVDEITLKGEYCDFIFYDNYIYCIPLWGNKIIRVDLTNNKKIEETKSQHIKASSIRGLVIHKDFIFIFDFFCKKIIKTNLNLEVIEEIDINNIGMPFSCLQIKDQVYFFVKNVNDWYLYQININSNKICRKNLKDNKDIDLINISYDNQKFWASNWREEDKNIYNIDMEKEIVSLSCEVKSDKQFKIHSVIKVKEYFFVLCVQKDYTYSLLKVDEEGNVIFNKKLTQSTEYHRIRYHDNFLWLLNFDNKKILKFKV